MTRPLLIQGMRGLGDNIYQRPFVRAVASRRPVFLDTPWPQLYSDLPGVSFVRPSTHLRTQAKNRDLQDAAIWTEAPREAQRVHVGYGSVELRRGSIIRALESKLSLNGAPFVFDLPPTDFPPVAGRYVVIRPVTVRREWTNTARNPKPEYLAAVARWFQEAGFAVVLVADLEDRAEWLVGPLPPHDAAYLKGELGVDDLVALVRGAAATVGGVGWLVPMSIAAGTPLFCVLGGQLLHNGPSRITDPRMNLSGVGWTFPDRPCECEKMQHNCLKTNSSLRRDFETWMNHAGPRL
jgi:ADP-heptose:LPS heptosyltransferase